jgi:hypothetical protein
MPRLVTQLANLLIGLPGGCLIVMGMLLFNTLLNRLVPAGSDGMLGLLCLTSLAVGLLARWMRPLHGLGAAIASGLVAAGILLSLHLAAAPGAASTLIFGPPGMAACLAFSALGGWLPSRLQRRAP